MSWYSNRCCCYCYSARSLFTKLHSIRLTVAFWACLSKPCSFECLPKQSPNCFWLTLTSGSGLMLLMDWLLSLVESGIERTTHVSVRSPALKIGSSPQLNFRGFASIFRASLLAKATTYVFTYWYCVLVANFDVYLDDCGLILFRWNWCCA